MKKILIVLSITLVSFLGIDKLSAETMNVNKFTYITYNLTDSGTNATYQHNNEIVPFAMINNSGLKSRYEFHSFIAYFDLPTSVIGKKYYNVTINFRLNYSGFDSAVQATYANNLQVVNMFFNSSASHDYSVSSRIVSSGSNYVDIELTTSGYFNSNIPTNSFGFSFSTSGAHLFLSTNQTSRYLQISNLKVNYAVSEDPNTAILGDINNSLNDLNNQQQQTNNKLDNLDKTQQETNNKLDDLNDSITSTEGPDLDGLDNTAGWLPSGPVDSLLNLPLSIANAITGKLSQSCSPITLPLPFVDDKISLPCGTTLYSKVSGLNIMLNTIFGILSAVILFRYFMKLYKWVDDTLTFRENNHMDNWGGV